MIAKKIKELKEIIPSNVTLVAVSKTKSNELITEAYNSGQRIFGENKVQELIEKYEKLPKDISWHMIGHLQRNKVKYIASFIDLIHGVDSLKLLKEINQQGKKIGRKIPILLQFHIAEEENKFGFKLNDFKSEFTVDFLNSMKNIEFCGIMGMASFTSDQNQIANEFFNLNQIFRTLKQTIFKSKSSFNELSMGMSSDYQIAIEYGSTMIRIGSTIFGERKHHKQITCKNIKSSQ